MTREEFVRAVERELGRTLTGDERGFAERTFDILGAAVTDADVINVVFDLNKAPTAQESVESAVDAIRTGVDTGPGATASEFLPSTSQPSPQSVGDTRVRATSGYEAEEVEAPEILQQAFEAAANAGHERDEVVQLLSEAQQYIQALQASDLPPPIGSPTTVEEYIQAQVDQWQQEARALRGAPIGVPDTFAAQRESALPATAQEASQAQTTDLLNGRPVGTPRTRISEVEPRYFSGDQFSPAGLAPERIAKIQKQLVTAGLLDDGEFYAGFWDTTTASAYTSVLGWANQRGTDAQNALNDLAANVPDSVKEARNAAKLAKQFQTPAYVQLDPDKAAQQVKSYMRSQLGREPTDAEMASLSGVLSGLYRSSQEAEIARMRSEFVAGERGLETGVAQTPAAVQGEDYGASVSQYLDKYFGPEMNFIQGQQETALNMRNVMDSITTMSRLVR